MSSAWSTRTSAARATRAICRHSSEPIEPPAPGDHHDLTREVGADPLDLHPHRLAAQDVLDAHLAQLAGDVQVAGAVAEQLEHRRGRADLDTARAAGGHHAGAQRARGGGDRDHHLVGLDLVEHARQVLGFGGAQHLEPVLVLHPQLARVVVDEPDGAQAELRVADQLAYDEPTALASAHDEDVTGTLGGPEAPDAPLDDQMDEEPGADQQRHREQEEQRDHAARQVDRGPSGTRTWS